MTETLLGGIGLTHLTVYHDPPGPDGVCAGCAHIHAITPEAYFGVAGEGAIELHDPEHGFRRKTIKKGTFVQFPPGTLHRSVSTDNLEVLAVMGNGGLAERGDARIYFGRQVDETPGEYERLRDLVKTGRDGALARRDASAQAYGELLRLWNEDKVAYQAELERFFAVHRRDLASRTEALRAVVEDGPVRVADEALHNLAHLASGDRIRSFACAASETFDGDTIFGMCGTLRPVKDLNGL
jgi:hypothetical protein